LRDHTPEGDRNARRRPRARRAIVAAFTLVVVAAPLAATAAIRADHSAPPLVRAEDNSRATQSGPSRATPSTVHAKDTGPGVAHLKAGKPLTFKPHQLLLTRAGGPVFDVRKLKGAVVKRERPEHEDPFGPPEAAAGSVLPSKVSPSAMASAAAQAPAPGPDSSFDGLDFATWGAGHPPDENGDVGPTYYIQVVNTSIGIYDKSTGTRVAAFTFDAFMSQGNFGNLCDTDNFGDPVVLYDSFENRWFITDFAFQLDGSGNVVNPPGAFQCFAVSKTGDPVSGGWNFYSIAAPGALNDYPKFGVWPDGIYMSANMFGYPASGSYEGYHAWALNKQQMYADAPTAQVIDFAGDTSDFTVIPANARLQAGTPPSGSSEYFVSTEQFLNALSIYKFHVDWDKPSTSTFTGPLTQLQPNCWPNATPANASTPANAADVLAIRAMAQAQYTNIGGAESLWVDHTVQRGASANNTTCNAPTGGNATIRWYQANVTGGTVAANVVQGASFDPEGTNTFFRFMPSLAVDHLGDMAIGYTKSNSTTNPQIKYAGRLAGDAANTLGQSEQTLINGTGAQSGNCGPSTCVRWGDYSGMALDPNGCEFWMTGEYYATNGLNDLTRIGSFHYPGCTPVGNGTLSGNVTDGTNPIATATVSLGSRTTTTDGSGHYSFTVPAGTYASLTASKPGFDDGSVSTVTVPDGGTATRNFTLNPAAQSGCFTDNSQATFQRGNPANCDLVSSPGNVFLARPELLDQHADDNGFGSGYGFSNTALIGETFTAGMTGKLERADAYIFCASCSGTNPNMTLELRTTSGGLPNMSAGGLLASSTISGTGDPSGGMFEFPFATEPAVTAGTQYGLVIRLTASRTGTQAWLATSGDVMAGGRRVVCSTSACSTPTGQNSNSDLVFSEYVSAGYASAGTFISSLKDANPQPGSTADWTTLSWTATTPAGTGVKFQIAASNNQYGPFNFVGPDGTASTFFTTSGVSLSQFNGKRYLKYKAFLSTNSGLVTPSLSSVSVCFNDTSSTTATTLTVDPATGTFGGTTNLSATLTNNGTPVANEPVAFTLNGSSVGSSLTNASGVATRSNISLTGISAGSYPTGVGASFAGDTGLDSSTGSGSLTVSKANQVITVSTHAPSTAVYGTSFGVAASAPGGAVTFSSSGGCSNVGATFTMTSGTTGCTVKYDQAGNGNYNAAPQVTETVTAQKAAQAITVTTHAPASAVYGTSFGVAASAQGGAVTFSSSGGCSNVGGTFTMTSGTTSCSVMYDQPGNANYNAAPQMTESVTAQKASQSITVTTHAPASAVFGASFGVAASAPGGAVTFSNGGGCSNVGGTFTMTSGTTGCTVKYDQAGNGNYNAASQVTESVTAQKAAQTITVTTHAPASAVFNTQFSVAANGGGSGNPVTFSNGGGCSNVGATFTMTSGTTTCQVRYDESGDANYNAASQVTESVTAQKAAQTITVTAHAPSTAVYGTSFGVAGSAPGGLVTFSSGGVCLNVAGTFTMMSGTGTCTVMYDQVGNSNYNAAPEVTETVSAVKAAQSISVTTHAPSTAAFASQFTVAANAPGGAIAYSSGGSCSNGGATFTMTSASGTCTVAYDQAGNGNYNAAPEVIETVTAAKADQAITVTIHAPANALVGSSFDVAATAPGGPVAYSSSGSCSNVGATFTMNSNTGSCTVMYDQAGNANYNAAPEVTETVIPGKSNQTISVTTHAPASAVYGSQFTVAANAPGGAVTLSSGGSCSHSGATFTMTSGSGTCTVMYDQAGNANYNAAPEVTEAVTAVKADQTISVTTHAPASAVYGSQFTVAANAPRGAVTYSSSGSCSNGGATFTMTSGTGTCSVKYDQLGDANYSAAPTVIETVTAVKAAQSITVTTHAPAKATSGSQFTVAATAPGGAISYSSAGVCTNSGPTFTMTSAKGTCTVRYDQAGNSNYVAAPEVSEKVKAVAAFGGFRAPTPKSSNKAGAKITVKFTLRDATGHPLTSAEAAALAAAGSVKVVLSGPNTSSRKRASARCRWVSKSRAFSCVLKTPSGLKTGKANRYSLTALQNVDGTFEPIPPSASKAAAANPETIFFKKRRRQH
jgi:Carboxypeptidase regulatory-like domain